MILASFRLHDEFYAKNVLSGISVEFMECLNKHVSRRRNKYDRSYQGQIAWYYTMIVQDTTNNYHFNFLNQMAEKQYIQLLGAVDCIDSVLLV